MGLVVVNISAKRRRSARFLVFRLPLLAAATVIKYRRKREGLPADEHWRIGDGPDDYQAPQAESNRLLERIRGTLIASLFERYRMSDLAKMYERDRMRFDVMLEAGRRFPKQDREASRSLDESMTEALCE